MHKCKVFPLSMVEVPQLKKQGWQHQIKRFSETVEQTNINTCRVSELNKQNKCIKSKEYLLEKIALKKEYNVHGHIFRTWL